eukprot:scaffold6249_cov395-Prasinococcus_capsulatus_cf.AAC.3
MGVRERDRAVRKEPFRAKGNMCWALLGAEPAILPEKAKVAFQSAVIEGLILFGEDLVSKYDTDSDDCITVEEFVTTTKAIAPQVVEEFGEHNFRVYTEYTFQVIKEKRSMQGFGSDGDLVLRDPSFHGRSLSNGCLNNRGSISIQAFNDSISEVLDLHRSSEKDRARLAPVQESDREFGSISGSESGRTSGLQESQTDVSVIVEGTSVVTEDEPVKPQQTLQRRHTSTSSMKQDKDKQDKAKPQSEHTLLLHGFANQLGSRAEELEEKLEELNEERFDEWQILYCGNARSSSAWGMLISMSTALAGHSQRVPQQMKVQCCNCSVTVLTRQLWWLLCTRPNRWCPSSLTSASALKYSSVASLSTGRHLGKTVAMVSSAEHELS